LNFLFTYPIVGDLDRVLPPSSSLSLHGGGTMLGPDGVHDLPSLLPGLSSSPRQCKNKITHRKNNF
jgi:hypothetical protein